MREYKNSIERINNRIIIHKMSHPAAVTDFLNVVYQGINRGYKEFFIEWDGNSIFPNACTPISGIIQYYHNTKDIKFEFNISLDSYLAKCGFIQPYYKEAKEIINEYNPFDKIFEYSDSAQVAQLTQSYINAISHNFECSEGVIEGLIWCINEVLDNVLLHSEVNKGYVMAQIHPTTKHIAICVYDYGVGIYNTLKSSKHNPQNTLDALSLSIQEGVGDGKGQGNGLFGLYSIINDNSGLLTITSGNASIMYTANKEFKKFTDLTFISKNNAGTIIDFQLDLSKNIDIKGIFRSIGGFDGFDIRIDDMFQYNDVLQYDVYENCSGTATREAGEQIRNDVINTFNRTKKLILLDFINVKTVSSSFIDELIGKLIIKFGIVKFNQIFKIINMNDTITFLCERAIYMRISSEWNNKN